LSPPAREICGRKAPRVQRIASSFREEVREAALSIDRASGRLGRTHEISAGSLAHRATPRRLQPGGERQRDTRCPSHIGLGRSLHREPSRLEGACRGARERKSTSKRPLTRETSAPRSSSCSGQTGMREEITADRPRAGDDEAKAPPEQQRGRVSIVRWSCLRIVSLAEVDERRVASNAPER